MSLPIGYSLAAAVAAGLIGTVFFRTRSIGGFVADVTVEEVHGDELVITEHPVEQGSAVSDHAFKRPATVVIRAGWSNSSLLALANPNYAAEVYDQLLALQASRRVFDIITGKRLYTNMLIRRLTVTTDEKTENVLLVTCECQEVIFATTTTTTVADPTKMADPASTQGSQTRGTVTVRSLSSPVTVPN